MDDAVLSTTPEFTVSKLGGLYCLFLENQDGPYIWGFTERGEAESMMRALNIAIRRVGCYADRTDATRYRKLVASGKYCAATFGGGWGLLCGSGPHDSKACLDAAVDALPRAGTARLSPRKSLTGRRPNYESEMEMIYWRFGYWIASWLDIICGAISVLTLTFYRPGWDFDFRVRLGKRAIKRRMQLGDE